MHGGNSPQAKAKAENMLAQARIPGIEALHEIINQFLEHTCAACGYPTGDSEQQRTVIAAAKVVLDRTQMGPSSTVHVNANGTESDLSLATLTDDERAELACLVGQLTALKARVKARLEAIVGNATDEDAPGALVM